MAKQAGQFITDNLVKDASNAHIQIGSSFQTQDASASPQSSPLTYTSGVVTIVVPDNAVEFIVNPSVALNVSEQASVTHYDVVAASTKESIPCARMQNIYLSAGSGGTINFRFTLI